MIDMVVVWDAYLGSTQVTLAYEIYDVLRTRKAG